MTEGLDNNVKTISQKLEHGLSEEEHKWMQKWFEGITDKQEKQIRYLRMINTALQIIAVIILLSAILAACGALSLGVRF